jgi:U3 small nucleolar ribonucleoprotein protein LCP5
VLNGTRSHGRKRASCANSSKGSSASCARCSGNKVRGGAASHVARACYYFALLGQKSKEFLAKRRVKSERTILDVGLSLLSLLCRSQCQSFHSQVACSQYYDLPYLNFPFCLSFFVAVVSENGVDLLAVKRSMLLSYMIDMTKYTKLRMMPDADSLPEMKLCVARLNEMRVMFEKARPLAQKAKYSIDKLVAQAAAGAGGAEAMNVGNTSDPLSYRPNPNSLEGAEEQSSSSKKGTKNNENSDDDESAASSEDEDDELLKSAKADAEMLANSKKSKKKGGGKNADDDQNNKEEEKYRAPRMHAVHYMEQSEKREKAEERELKRNRDKMRRSEVMQTLMEEYSDRPEEDTMDGGADYGMINADDARRLEAHTKEKEDFEEERMVRLVTSKKEKMLRRRLEREGSNINAIADLSKIADGIAAFDRVSKKGSSKRGSDADDYNNSGSNKPARYEDDGQKKKRKGNYSA